MGNLPGKAADIQEVGGDFGVARALRQNFFNFRTGPLLTCPNVF